MAETITPTGQSVITSDTGPFSIIPEWVLYSGVSARAIQLYAILSRHADFATLACYPSRKTLASKMGECPLKAVDRATKELVEIGALDVHKRFDPAGDRTTNHYRVIRAHPLVLSLGGDTSDTTGSDTSDIENENQLERESPSGSVSPSGETRVDPVWDALDEHFHPSTPSERSNVGKTARELRVAWDDPNSDPASDVRLAAEIHRRMGAYWPDLTRTPTALRNRWSELGRRADEAAAPGSVITREGMLAQNGPCLTCDGTGAKGDVPFACRDCGGTGVEGWL